MSQTRNSAENILSTLSPEAVNTLEAHFRQQVAQEIAGGLTKPAEKKRRPLVESSEPRKRDKGYSAFIRAYDAEHTKDGEAPKANDVVAAAAEQGLEIKPFHVYNVRNQAKKAAEKASDSESEVKRQEEIQAKREESLAKAREARKAKAETGAAPVKPVKRVAKKA